MYLYDGFGAVDGRNKGCFLGQIQEGHSAMCHLSTADGDIDTTKINIDSFIDVCFAKIADSGPR